MSNHEIHKKYCATKIWSYTVVHLTLLLQCEGLRYADFSQVLIQCKCTHPYVHHHRQRLFYKSWLWMLFCNVFRLFEPFWDRRITCVAWIGIPYSYKCLWYNIFMNFVINSVFTKIFMDLACSCVPSAATFYKKLII